MSCFAVLCRVKAASPGSCRWALSARVYSYTAFGWTPAEQSNFSGEPIMNTSYLQVLGTGQTDSFPSIGLMCPRVRLVFNSSENQQRVLAEHTEGIRLSRVNCFFFTRGHWDNIAGMPGSCLTHWQVGKYNLNYCGPKATSNILRSLVPFTMHPAAMPEAMAEYSSEDATYPVQTFDDGVTVTPLVFSVPITQSEPRPQQFLLSGSMTPSPASSDNESDSNNSTDDHPPAKRSFVGAFSRPSSNASSSSPGGHTDEISTAYVCQLPDLQGTFNPRRATELGVKKGALFGKLSSGHSVTLPDGKVVTPEEVNEPMNKGTCFIVVECATSDFVAPITSSNKFSKWQIGGEKADAVAVLVHMTPQDIIDSDTYQTWMKSFAPTVKHLCLNRAVAPAPLVQFSGTKLQAQLNVLDQRVFPIPYYSYQLPAVAADLPENCRSGDLMLAFALYKQTGRKNRMLHGWSDMQVQTPIDVNALRDELLAIPNVLPAVEELRKVQRELEQVAQVNAGTANASAKSTEDPVPPCEAAPEPTQESTQTVTSDSGMPLADKADDILASLAAISDRRASDRRAKDPDVLPWTEASTVAQVPSSFDPLASEVVFLGTGAAIPGKFRNVSAILLKFGELSMLMDGGEGTLGQMYRQFGLDLDRVLCGLRLISISHIHADHQSGIASVLLERESACKRLGWEVPPVVVIGPTTWMTFYRYLASAMVVPDISFFGTNRATGKGLATDVLARTGLPITRLYTHPVLHSVPAWASVVEIRGKQQADGSVGKGYTLVYSGDTKPCQTLADAARGADLLIHEATFDSGLVDKSMDKCHSTIGEALGIGEKMATDFVILTHFSQRYKMPILDDCSNPPVPFGVAFDMMTVRLGELSRLPKLIPMLQMVFDARDNAIRSRDSSPVGSPHAGRRHGSPHHGGARRYAHTAATGGSPQSVSPEDAALKDGGSRSPVSGSPRGRRRGSGSPRNHHHRRHRNHSRSPSNSPSGSPAR
ncbi:zinc phosphodiesterase ELAC protein 2-like [Sycon ciliatum]|uniref:zinc phosphodiesterase ELAC protein 2-like n=1 Tax=Sycon ciliatum TaxID=27933 RepID=UPI0031F6F710